MHKQSIQKYCSRFVTFPQKSPFKLCAEPVEVGDLEGLYFPKLSATRFRLSSKLTS